MSIIKPHPAPGTVGAEGRSPDCPSEPRCLALIWRSQSEWPRARPWGWMFVRPECASLFSSHSYFFPWKALSSLLFPDPDPPVLPAGLAQIPWPALGTVALLSDQTFQVCLCCCAPLRQAGNTYLSTAGGSPHLRKCSRNHRHLQEFSTNISAQGSGRK